MARFSSFALATLLTLGSTVSAAHAGVTDIEHLGSGGLCNTSEQTGGLLKIGDDMAIGKGTTNKDCNSVLGLIDKLRDKEINSEERINNKLINSQHTLGMINSIGSIAAPLLGGLMANFQTRPQATPPAADNSQYLQIIQQQQQQIDELRQLMAQRQAPISNPSYTTVQSPVQQSYTDPSPARHRSTSSSTLRQVNLF